MVFVIAHQKPFLVQDRSDVEDLPMPVKTPLQPEAVKP
jgi:hypothetical protein